MNLNNQINSIDKNQMEFIMKFGQRSNIINGFECKPLLEYSFRIVKYEIPELLQEGKYLEIAKILFDGKLGIVTGNQLLYFVLWLLDEIDHINKIEIAKLQSQPDLDLQLAGINQLDIFGYLNVVDTLANGDILKWDMILDLPYQNVLDKMIKNNIEKNIQKNYQSIIKNKK